MVFAETAPEAMTSALAATVRTTRGWASHGNNEERDSVVTTEHYSGRGV